MKLRSGFIIIFMLYTQGLNSALRYSISNVQPVSGLGLFYIWPETGQVTVSSPLTAEDEQPRYVVCTALYHTVKSIIMQ